MKQSVNVKFRTTALLVVVLLLLVGLVGRLVWLHCFSESRGRDRARAVKQSRAVFPLMARRGMILDRRGRVLATSVKIHSVFADPWLLAQTPRRKKQNGLQPALDRLRLAAVMVAPILDLNAAGLRHKLQARRTRRFVWLKRDVSPDELEALRNLKRQRKYRSLLRGIGWIAHTKRHYPNGRLGAHVLGFVGRDDRGLEGVERQFDQPLAGRDGKKEAISDIARRPLWMPRHRHEPPEHGRTLVLTLDLVIEEITERALAEAVKKFDAESGMAIVMAPRSGEVLAMANVPTFDPSRPCAVPVDARRNRCLTDPFEPGSTFKCFIAAAALDAGWAQTQETIFCHNGIHRFSTGRVIHDVHPYGDLSFADVLVKSSNIGMGIIGTRLGNRRMYTAVRRFGFGRTTGIELPGENGGIVRPLKKWGSYTTTSIPIGQEIGVTGLQLLTAFCTFANKGILPEPRIVRGLLTDSGRPVADWTSPKASSVVIRPDVARTMIQTLTQVVQRGTGRRARIEGIEVFGKTGTAQIPGLGGYEQDAYVASFLAAAPAEAPRLAVLVSVRRPDRKKGYYGGTVSAPVAKKILRRSLAYLNVPRRSEQLAHNWPNDGLSQR